LTFTPHFNILYNKGTVVNDNEKSKEELIAELKTLRKKFTTESKKQKSASETRLHNILDATPFPIAVVDLDDKKIIYWSKSALDLFGHIKYDTEEWYKIAYPEPDYRKKIITIWKSMLPGIKKSGQTVNTGEYQVTCADGSIRVCELYARYVDDNLIVTFNDVTDKIKASETVQKEKFFLDEALNSLPGVFYLFNQEGRFVMWNSNFTEVTGYSDDEMKKIHPTELFEGKHRKMIARAIETVFTAGEVTVEAEFTTKSGEQIPYFFTGKKVVLNEELYLVGMGIDLTQRKQLERDLANAQKMKALGTLAGGIAHDFNNILNAIFGYGQLAGDSVPKDSELYSYISEIIGASRRATDLVRQILSFSRQDNQHIGPIDICEVVDEACKLLRSSIPSTCSIVQDFEPVCGPVIADPTRIHQVVMNLVTNSYQSMLEKETGVITVSLAPVTINPLNQLQLSSGDYIQLKINDNGKGISPDEMGQIFEPYFTTKERGDGTGLGLAIVYNIIRQYNGAITVESTPGSGTTFDIYLPVTTGSAEHDSEAASFSSIDGGSERILLVDDDTSLARMNKKILEKLGYSVQVFTDSKEALKQFSIDPAAFDMVLTDMTMPNLTGKEMAEKMLILRPDLPVILLTGYSNLITREEALAAGISDFLLKPVSIDDLAASIRKILA
jgi:PAS domain S-box-containing protein